ncbi:hypothetical protein MBLNU230_g2024t1 [Neophaeotheca triangularis]
MSTSADDQYEAQNDAQAGNDPVALDGDDEYTSRTGQKQAPVPVQNDGDGVADPIDGDKADSDEQLQQDENEAIDKSNIMSGRTRGAAKGSGTYQEPGDEEGMPPAEDGTSRLRTG